MAEDVVAFEHVEVGHGHGAADGMAGEGEAVGEAGLALQEGLHQSVTGDHRPQRGIPAGQTLGHRDDVRLVVITNGAEPFTETSESADDLVRHEENTVEVADLPHPGEITRRWCQTATGVLDGLEVDGRHGVGAFAFYGPTDLVRRPASEGLEVVPVLR